MVDLSFFSMFFSSLLFSMAKSLGGRVRFPFLLVCFIAFLRFVPLCRFHGFYGSLEFLPFLIFPLYFLSPWPPRTSSRRWFFLLSTPSPYCTVLMPSDPFSDWFSGETRVRRHFLTFPFSLFTLPVVLFSPSTRLDISGSP